jgi:hypothetical protein
MGVHVTLPLFAGPGHELEEGAVVTGRQLRDVAANLHDRLNEAADLVDRLGADGWAANVAQYDLLFGHPHVENEEQALRRLRELNIDPERFMIVEDVAEDDEPTV